MKKRTKAGYERRSRGICEEDQQLIRKMIQENQQPAVILSSANYDPLSRRKRIAWTPGEVMYVPPFGEIVRLSSSYRYSRARLT